MVTAYYICIGGVIQYDNASGLKDVAYYLIIYSLA